MAKPAKRRESPVTFKHSVEIEVRRPRLEAFGSLHQLDMEKIAQADRAVIELGYLKSECCQQLVKAIIRKGMVTELQIEPCAAADRVKPPLAMRKLLEAALKRAARGNPRPPKFPLPVAVLMKELISVTTITCVQICFFGWCIACCQTPANDWIC